MSEWTSPTDRTTAALTQTNKQTAHSTIGQTTTCRRPLIPAWCPGGRTTQNAFRHRPATTCVADYNTLLHCSAPMQRMAATAGDCARVNTESRWLTVQQCSAQPLGFGLRCGAAPHRQHGKLRRRRTALRCTTPAPMRCATLLLLREGSGQADCVIEEC